MSYSRLQDISFYSPPHTSYILIRMYWKSSALVALRHVSGSNEVFVAAAQINLLRPHIIQYSQFCAEHR